MRFLKMSSSMGSFSVFSNNLFGWIAKGPHISGGEIGPQEHKGNQWIFPEIEANGDLYLLDIQPSFGYHIKCTPNPANSLFSVHTDQATVPFDIWHPYHPLDIEPDVDNEFFQQTPGSPQTCPLPGFAEDVPDIHKWLADGYNATQLGISEYELWQKQRRLYRLLQTNAAYYASYTGFPAFVAQHQNGSVGKFHQIHTLFSQSTEASQTLTTEILSQQQNLSDKIAEISHIDSLLGVETSPVTIASLKAAKAAAAEDVASAQEALVNLQQEYESPRTPYYQQAQILNSTVNAAAIYEVNERMFNQVMLNALLNQSGNLTEQDAQILKDIAVQCPKIGGIAVIKSRTLLEDCHKLATNDNTVGCLGELPTQYEVITKVASSPRNEEATQASLVVNEELILNVFFVEESRYFLYDMNGRELISGNLYPSLRVQIPSTIANGVYVCTVELPSGKTIAQKVVISR
ncbi:MAG: T9SS type A sorting domain-containing protein [Saprospiraceae bacterium]|nr:T9SS type A sorting domain-containing protein [Saprospiraceae bacterium]